MVSRLFTTYEEIEAFFNDRKKLGIKPGLRRIERLLELLGNPQKTVQAVHIAGTNGKGSTVHFLNNALKANGYNTGVFTSPSLSGLTGHFYLNNEQMSKMEILTLFNTVYPQIITMDKEGDAPTEYEILTAIGWLFFAKYADIALIEAGMGGREDTTNCFTPILSIITNVSFDHMRFIGSTLPEIAYHKAGIIKNQVPVILGKIADKARPVIDREIQINKSCAAFLDEEYVYEKQNENKFLWKWKDRELSVHLQMLGEHQMKNASLALMALFRLKQLNWKISIVEAVKAIEGTTIPGRFEKIRQDPAIILDAAHNPAGIAAFISAMNQLYDSENVKIIFTAFRDKDVETMLKKLIHQFNDVTLTGFPHPRSIGAADFEKYAHRYDINIARSWKEKVHDALGESNAIYCFTGSFHFVSSVRDYLLEINE